MKNLLEREIKALGEIKDKELVIYVTKNILDDIENINDKLSNLISASTNMMRYLRELGIKNEEVYENLRDNYNDLEDLERFKGNALLVYNLLSGKEVKNKDNKINKAIGFSDGKDKSKEVKPSDNKKEEVKKDNVIDESNPALNSEDLTLMKIEIAKRIIQTIKDNKILDSKEKAINMYNSIKDHLPKDLVDMSELDKFDFNNINGYLDMALGMLNTDKAHEGVDDVTVDQLIKIEKFVNKLVPKEDTNKADSEIFANVGYNSGLKDEEPKTKLGLDISKLNNAANEMVENVSKHISEDPMTDDKKSKRQAAREKDTVVCNLCKDPACDRKPGDLHSKCLHYGKGENK